MQQPRHRIRRHRRPARARRQRRPCVIATMASASSTLPIASRASAGPAATPRAHRPRAVPDPTGHGRTDVRGPADARPATRVPPASQGAQPDDRLPRRAGRRDRPPTGSREFFPQTSDWFRTSSYGRLDYRPEAPVKDWLRMPLPFSEYGIERGSPYEPGYRQLVKDIVTAADPKVDFSAYDLINVLVTPNAGPSALDTVLSVTFSGNDDAPHRRRRPARQHVLRLQPPGRRLGLVRGDRLPRAAPRERPRLRAARPLHDGRRRLRRALGHHVRGLGRQQRPPGLAQVEARLARQRPDQLRRHARHQRAPPRTRWPRRAAPSWPSSR